VNKNSELAKFVLLLCVGLFVAVFAALAPANAQETTASITGFVTDASGAAVAGASVTATDAARGTAYPTQTNGDGAYYLARLPIGKYAVKVEARGFQTAARPAFDLVLDQVARVDFQMTVGAMSQTIEVTGAAPLLQTETTDISTHIDSVVTENIPLITGNYSELTLLTPEPLAPIPERLSRVKTRFRWVAFTSTAIANRRTTMFSMASTTIRATTTKWPTHPA